MGNITSENSFLVTKFRASLIAQLVKNPPAMQETGFDSWVGKIPWRRDRLPIPVFLGFPCGSAGKESACNAGDLALMPGSGRFPWIEERLQELPGRNKFKCKKRGK